jgi:hypothetical protein
VLNTDYLIVGAGASGMGFADQILTETDATMVIVDRHDMPGGHWNDAYPFVRLHFPSAFYGVGSRQLGANRIDEAGPNQGFYEQASVAEIRSYYDGLMRERLLPSGRVRYLPMSEYLGEGRIKGLVSGEATTVNYRKLVDTTFIQTEVPSTHTPSFKVAPGVKLIPPNALPREAPNASGYVIVGGGKTAIDAAVWLLRAGAAPDAITWIRPRDIWLLSRDRAQPGGKHFFGMAEGQASTLESAAEAEDLDDLFDRLERTGQLLRIDQKVKPTMYRGATASQFEVDMAGAIRQVIRKGRLLSIEPHRMVLEEGSVPATPGQLYIDCTARGLGDRPLKPVFDGDRITLQMIRANLVCLSVAVIAHVEAAYSTDEEKNALCRPMAAASSAIDWLTQQVADLQAGASWSQDPKLRNWLASNRLMGLGPPAMDDEAKRALAAINLRIREARPRSETNLTRLLEEAAGSAPAKAAEVVA